MRTLLLMLFAALTLAAGPISNDSPVDDVLDALDARGKDLKSLTADVQMTDIDPSIGDVADVKTGRFTYQALPGDDARFHLLLDKKTTGHKVEAIKLEWSYADGKLIDRDYRNQTQHTRQILKPGEKLELFKLDGPFPLPLGQDKADVHRHFDVKKIPPAKDDPASSVHLRLTPVPGTDLARKFQTIDLWVDIKTNMPIRISVLDQSNEKVTDLSNVQVNGSVRDADFSMEKVDFNKGWAITDN
jgi:outer membrane lipoprotein-sorting protein